MAHFIRLHFDRQPAFIPNTISTAKCALVFRFCFNFCDMR
jgi:hypothetical protein